MKTILRFVALIFLMPIGVQAELVNVSGALKTQFVDGGDRVVFHEVAFDIAEPMSCNGAMVERLVTLNGPFDLGNSNAFLPLNYALLGENLTLLYAANSVALDVDPQNLRMSDGVAACQVDVMRARKDLSNLYEAPVLENETAVAVRRISYRQDYDYDTTGRGENTLRTLVLDIGGSFDCRGNETSKVLMQWRSARASSVDQENILATDAVVIALTKNYLAISPSNYQDGSTLGIEGCVVESVRSLSVQEDPDQDSSTTGIALADVPAYCQTNATEFGLFTGIELSEAENAARLLGFDEGIAACQGSPNDYGLFSGEDVDFAFEQGMAECQGDPVLCGLFSQADLDAASEQALTDGRQQCIDDPASCQLFTQAMLDAQFQLGFDGGLEQGLARGLEQGIVQGLEQGIEQGLVQGLEEGRVIGLEEGIAEGIATCRDNPSQCNLFSSLDVSNAFVEGEAQGLSQGKEQGKAEGVQVCKENPASCGLFTQADIDQQTADIKDGIMKQVVGSLPRYQVFTSCLRNRNSLICQYRHYAKRYNAYGWWKNFKYKRWY